MRELVIKKCLKCGALVKVIRDCSCKDCFIKCCNEQMQELKANSTDGAIEKHKPLYTTKDNKLMLTSGSAKDAIKKGMNNAVTFGPFLIVNGKKANIKGNGGWGVANRTAIAQRKDGIVLFLVIDGRGADGSNGITIEGLISLLDRYGAYNAANLDGGGSSSLVIDNKLINNPRGYAYTGARYLPNE